MVDQLSGMADSKPWPETLEVPGIGVVRLVQPAKLYRSGETLAVIWPTVAPPVSPEVLRDRAATLGKPWQPSTAVACIGAQLSKDRYGWQVVNALTGGAWTVNDALVIPFEVPAGLISGGIQVGAVSGATDAVKSAAGGLAAAMAGATASAGTAVTGTALVLTVLPWIALAAGLGLGGFYLYKWIKR